MEESGILRFFEAKFLRSYAMRKELKASGVKPLEAVHVKKDGNPAELLGRRCQTVIYNDGSEKRFGISWDLKSVDFSHPGTYEIEGSVIFPDYGDVLVEQRADPYVLLAPDGWYYFTASYPVCGLSENEQGIGYDRIILRRARTLKGLSDAREVTIWHQNKSKRLHRYVWAPELHEIGGSYYMIFTASIEENNVWGIRPHMLKCMGEDLMDPDNWTLPDESNLYRLEALEGDMRPFGDFSLDMTYFSCQDKHYLAWAQKETEFSNIYLAEIDEKEPWKLKSAAMLLTTPEYPWEMRGHVKVDEGPFALKHDGKIYLAFSASAVDYTYCIGFLEADETADLLEEDNWKKYGYPFLTSDDFSDQCGPGHNSFTTDENGNTVLLYHARPYDCSNGQDAQGRYGSCEYIGQGEEPLCDPCRHARAKGIHFAKDGLPVLHLTAEEELPECFRKVSIEVIIE